jgi:hypothetical protein
MPALIYSYVTYCENYLWEHKYARIEFKNPYYAPCTY